MSDEIKNLNELRGRISGPVFTPGDHGYADEIACFNLGVIHSPELVVGAKSEADVVEAVNFAKEAGLPVSVQATGHTDSAVTSGMFISIQRMSDVSVDADTGIATIGGGARWEEVIPKATALGLAPIAGSSPKVGVTGYLMGGGLGPLVRSHGVSSDYLTEVRIVTGEGRAVTASADENPDLFWAVRGGKYGLGIVTQSKVKLVELATLYGGSLFFAEEDIEEAYRGWIKWTATADERVSTSAAIIQFPPFDEVPEPLRGRRLLNIRFAFPGSVEEGAQLAGPIRALAPVYMDMLDEMPASAMAMIHNDPTEPSPSWARGASISTADDDFVSKLLGHVGAGTTNPFVALELRHLGAAAARDVEGGSAVGGRDAKFIMAVIAADPTQFTTGIPVAYSALVEDLAPWLAPVSNINFIVAPGDQEHLESAWSPETWERLEQVRKKYDPDQVLAPYPV